MSSCCHVCVCVWLSVCACRQPDSRVICPSEYIYIREREGGRGRRRRGGRERRKREREREMFMCNIHALQPLIPKSLVV